jgi:hypothetical protein
MTVDDENIIYQLHQRAQYLCRLCATWQAKVRIIPTDSDIGDCWGPSEAEISDALMFEHHGSWDVEFGTAEDEEEDENDGLDGMDLEDQEYDWFSNDDIGDDNGDLLEEMEASALNYVVDLDAYL